MGTYKVISEARGLFGIGEEETIGDVKMKINALLKQWHPDTGSDASEERKEKTVALLRAKKAILDYCDAYKISFSEDTIEKYLSPEERWMKSFGSDHVWGGGTGE